MVLPCSSLQIFSGCFAEAIRELVVRDGPAIPATVLRQNAALIAGVNGYVGFHLHIREFAIFIAENAVVDKLDSG